MDYDEFKRLRRERKFRYNLIGDPTVLNIVYIYPLKQKQVSDIVNQLKEYKYVNKIVIFGSSVTDRCHEYSDLDIAIDIGKAYDEDGFLLDSAKKVFRLIEKITFYKCDVVFIGYEGELVKKAIENGVTVFSRKE